MAYISLTPQIYLSGPSQSESIQLKNFVKKVIAESGGVASSIEDLGTTQYLLSTVFNKIQSSDLVIADLTLSNPNVLIEVGIALGMRKKVLLIASSDTPLPYPSFGLTTFLYSKTNLTELGMVIKKIVKDVTPSLESKVKWYGK